MPVRDLSIGKLRGLQQCSTERHAIVVMALDHRNNLRHALNPEAPETVSSQEMSTFKTEVVSILSPATSAVLLDPEFGGAQSIAANALPGRTGLVMAVEATGYTGNPTERTSQILSGWSVEKARCMGANAIKLLVYYHPDSPAAKEIDALVRRVGEDCQAQDIPLFLEPLSYSLDPGQKKLVGEERKRVVLETARQLTSIPGVDVLKAEFPLDIQREPDEAAWSSACQALTEASQAPWVLLSASVDFETYMRQVAVALVRGASGVAVGRAVWQEAPLLSGDEREKFLREVALTRMRRITELCDASARPWSAWYQAPPVNETWYQNYCK